MRLMDGICILVAELVHNPGYSIVILGGECISYEGLKLKGAALALVVELIVESLGDVDVHGGVPVTQQLLHGVALQSSQSLQQGVT